MSAGFLETGLAEDVIGHLEDLRPAREWTQEGARQQEEPGSPRLALHVVDARNSSVLLLRVGLSARRGLLA